MEFLLKSSGLVVMLFLFYQILLQNETFFKSIRHFFLIGLIISLLIPLIEIPIYVKAVASEINSFQLMEVTTNNPEEISSYNWIHITNYIYIIGVIFFSFKFLIQLSSLVLLISKHKLKKQGDYYFVETCKNTSPFSFFNIIIYNKTQFNTNELQVIINHEKAHAIQWHTIDTILTHLLAIILWFNPFVWLYKKAVLQNLEFLADKYALKLTNNKKQYQLILLKTGNAGFCTAITNNFYNSLIKKRILMLQKNQSQNKKYWKFALLIPVLTAFIAAFSTKTIAQEKKLNEIENIDKLKVELQIDKNTTNSTLKEEAAFFKKQFNAEISFKGIKRNSKNEIIAIKITSKYKSNSTVFVRKSDEPILPIIVSYNSEIDKINIGDAIEKEKLHFVSKNKLNFKEKPDKEETYTFTTSKDKNMMWVSKKDKDTIKMSGNKIIWHKNDDNHIEVEVIETDTTKKKHNVKVSTATFISDDGEKTELILDEDNASENIYIIKTDGEKGKKHKVVKTQSTFVLDTDNETPLYILNEKEITAKEMESINPDTIQSINVLKGESATSKYGEKGKNGVVIITTKKD